MILGPFNLLSVIDLLQKYQFIDRVTRANDDLCKSPNNLTFYVPKLCLTKYIID